jgi:dsDNA-specific endonuclease/ATPase MutS2
MRMTRFASLDPIGYSVFMSDRDLDVIEMPIEGELDLHTFAPKDVKDLVADYVDEAASRGLDEIRVVHGKGTGALRRLVHGVLERHPLVVAFRLCDDREGGWGATKVTLRPPRSKA